MMATVTAESPASPEQMAKNTTAFRITSGTMRMASPGSVRSIRASTARGLYSEVPELPKVLQPCSTQSLRFQPAAVPRPASTPNCSPRGRGASNGFKMQDTSNGGFFPTHQSPDPRYARRNSSPKILEMGNGLPVRFQSANPRSRTLRSDPADIPPLMVRSITISPKMSTRRKCASAIVRSSPPDGQQRPASGNQGKLNYFSFISPKGSPRNVRKCESAKVQSPRVWKISEDVLLPPHNGSPNSEETSMSLVKSKLYSSSPAVNDDKQTESGEQNSHSSPVGYRTCNNTKLMASLNISPLETPPISSTLLTNRSPTHSPKHKSSQTISDNRRTQDVAVPEKPCDLKGAPAQKRASCRRNLVRDFERELTFRPELNQNSLKIASKSTRQHVPLVCRLSERKKKNGPTMYTFTPQINPHSVKLAQERAGKMQEVRAKQAQQVAKKTAEMESKCTFKPLVSEKSLRIAETLGTNFEKRQELFMERRKKAAELAQTPPQQKQWPGRLKRSSSFSERFSTHYSATTSTGQGPSTCRTTDTESTSASANNTLLPLAGNRGNISPSSSPSSSASSGDSEPAVLPGSPPTADKCLQGKTTESAAVVSSSLISSSSNQKQKLASLGETGSKTKIRSTKKRNSVAGVGGSPPKSSQEFSELEAVRFSSLRSDRDRVKYIKKVAERKIKQKKIFLIHGGYRLVRQCLRKRGWVEVDYYKNKHKPAPKAKRLGSKSSPRSAKGRSKGEEGSGADDDDDSDVDLDLGVSEEVYEDEEEYVMLSRCVRNNSPNFVWTLVREAALYDSLQKSAITNHFAKASSFTTKVDLSANLRNLVWYGDTDPDTFYPRCYCLNSEEEREMFIDDYRFTAAVNILKILSKRHATGRLYSASRSSIYSLSSESSTNLSERAVKLALRAAQAYVGSKDHDDIENSQLNLCPKVTKSEWDELINYFYKISAGYQVNVFPEQIGSINQLLDEIRTKSPQFGWDGHRNIWIVKPGAMSRGRGIVCLSKLDDILKRATGNASVTQRIGRHVVQKYIERPLLIYQTKFDIRQWFLVTDWNPLTMWMYQESYLRFSSQPYTLDSMDVSIHLCNNSIQKHYENSQSRSDSLPPENMWDSKTFQDYLSSIGRGDCWDSVIYPGMKKALIYALQVTQDDVEHRKNCFELYGADFMICADFRPWLIEINSSPTMESSTEVTARLCKQVLEDTLKVVIDRKESKDCDTGKFELAFKQPRVDAPPYVGTQLCVKGSSMKVKPVRNSALLHRQNFPSDNLLLRPSGSYSKEGSPSGYSCRSSIRLSYQSPPGPAPEAAVVQ